MEDIQQVIMDHKHIQRITVPLQSIHEQQKCNSLNKLLIVNYAFIVNQHNATFQFN